MRFFSVFVFLFLNQLCFGFEGCLSRGEEGDRTSVAVAVHRWDGERFRGTEREG